MKICIYADPHWSTYYSILRQRGTKYSKRLENLISSMNYVQELAVNKGCDRVLCLGDFFDRNTVTAEEIDALKEVRWNTLPQYLLVGNHEIVSTADSYSTTQIFTSMGFNVISKVQSEIINGTELLYIPYFSEENRPKLQDLITPSNKRVIFSHNDIKGIRYGAYESTEGFGVSEIESSCNLFINGHLHNGGFVNEQETILNLGNLTGKDFTEDGFTYRHYICILDTETLQLEFYLNPFAISFYKVEIKSLADLQNLASSECIIYADTSVVSFKVNEKILDEFKKYIEPIKFAAYRTVVYSDAITYSESTTTLLDSKVSHLDKLKAFCMEQIGNSELLQEELKEICA